MGIKNYILVGGLRRPVLLVSAVNHAAESVAEVNEKHDDTEK
jgi:hypothetical protein